MQNWGSTVLNLETELGRRTFLAGMLAAGVLALPGCATVIGQSSSDDLVRRLLTLSTQRAFARLTQPEGFWDSAVARIDLPVLFGRPGSAAAAVMRTPAFREKLQHRLNLIAEDGARAAAPVVTQAVRNLTITDAVALLQGGRTAATTYLRQSVGAGLLNAMIPELDRAMQVAQDPILNTAISALTGVNMGDAAKALAIEAENAIWYEVGAAESAIRENPASSNDPSLIDAFRPA